MNRQEGEVAHLMVIEDLDIQEDQEAEEMPMMLEDLGQVELQLL